ncbi:MAG: chemotaxis-specific protein-glutamate methyltransferase CheB [Pseudomonadota bacterium]
MRLMIVDDSALMRRWLKQCFEDQDCVIETARSGADALAKLESFNPDVITLDINMPEMDGLTCLAHIMTDMPRPVVMISSLTGEGALATLEALELGAVDYIEKPSGTVSHDIKTRFPEITAKVRAAAGAKTRQGKTRSGGRAGAPSAKRAGARPGAGSAGAAARRPRLATPGAKQPIDLVLIGVSTGGPGTIEEVLSAVSADLAAPILIAQHMPSRFAQVLADRLNSRLDLEVSAANGATLLKPGAAVVAGADADILVSKRGAKLMAVPTPLDPSRTWHPSVDRMVESAMECMRPDRLLAVQLTGMGDDGAAAMTALRQKGGRTIAESEESAVIFGMPKELIRRGGAEIVLPSSEIGETLNLWTGLRGARRAAVPSS